MDLRITTQTLVRNTIASVRRQFGEVAKLQEQAATGKKINRPSDAPVETIVLMANRAQEVRLDAYLGNIRDARTQLDTSVSALREAGDVMSSARDIAVEGSHASNDGTSFESLAQEVDALIDRFLNVANTQSDGQYLFGGTASASPPFSVSARDVHNRPQTFSYNGSSDFGSVLIGRQISVRTLYPGSGIFQTRERATTLYAGNTGSAAGTGLDSAVGQGTLIVRHTATTYAAGSGVQPGTGSASDDTIIGPAGAHHLTIVDTSGTGASGSISLDGGPAVTFTNTDTNLKVGGPNGETVFVDTTNITAGFSGDIDITADGTLSVDNGVSEIPITFSANQVVTDSQTGAVTNVDTTGTRRSGTESLDYSGSYDAFQILTTLRDDLRNVRGLSEHDQAEALSRHIGELDRVRESILNVVGEQSANLESMESLETRVQDRQLETQKQVSDIESADVSEIVLHLQEQQNLLQLTFASSARVLDLSLLDFLG